MSLEQAAEETRIPLRYLDALESNAPVASFPAPVYARAFLREYASYLGVDPEPLVAAFVARAPIDEVRLSLVPAAPPVRRWPARLVTAAAVAGVIGLAVYRVVAESGTGLVPPRLPTPAAAGVTSPAPPVPPHRPPAPTSGVHAQARFTESCWVRAVVDGKVVVQRTLLPGGRLTLSAKRSLDLVLGNAGGVVLTVNGHPVATGGPGAVIRLAFAWRAGHLVTV